MAKPTDCTIMVEPQSETDGGGWLATVPALPGCMGDGDTPEAALADAEVAIIEWHAAARRCFAQCLYGQYIGGIRGPVGVNARHMA